MLLKWWSKLPSNLHFALSVYNKYDFQEKTTFFSKGKSFSHDLENKFFKEWVTYEKFRTAENKISVKIVPFSLTFEHSLKSKVNCNGFR